MCQFKESTEGALEAVEKRNGPRFLEIEIHRTSEREIGKFLSNKRVNLSGFTTLYAFPNRFVFEQIPDLTKREIIPRDQASVEGTPVRRLQAACSSWCDECDLLLDAKNFFPF